MVVNGELRQIVHQKPFQLHTSLEPTLSKNAEKTTIESQKPLF